MYVQLQRQVKEYIIGELCRISEGWVFDIDFSDRDNPIIVGYGPSGELIRGEIEKIHKYLPSGVLKDMKGVYGNWFYGIEQWGGCLMIRKWFVNVFNIYGINYISASPNETINYEVIKRNTTSKIESFIYNNTLHSKEKFISPLSDYSFNKYIKQEQLIPPFLLLLDPIEYFRRYSIIIQKYEQLDQGYTLGIYEMLLEYFPEMNGELVFKFWTLKYVLGDLCTDIVFVMGSLLVDLCT